MWRATIKVPELDPVVLRHLLDALTAIDRHLLVKYHVPPLYQSGVRYRAEPPPAEDWLSAPIALVEGFADCEDLASWRAAELQNQGEPALAVGERQVVGGVGITHVTVQRPWSREDPSAVLGMR